MYDNFNTMYDTFNTMYDTFNTMYDIFKINPSSVLVMHNILN